MEFPSREFEGNSKGAGASLRVHCYCTGYPQCAAPRLGSDARLNYHARAHGDGRGDSLCHVSFCQSVVTTSLQPGSPSEHQFESNCVAGASKGVAGAGALSALVCRWRIHGLTSDCRARYRRARSMRPAPFRVNGRTRSARGATPTKCSARSHVLRRPGPPRVSVVPYRVAWAVPEAQGSLPRRRHALLARAHGVRASVSAL